MEAREVETGGATSGDERGRAREGVNLLMTWQCEARAISTVMWPFYSPPPPPPTWASWLYLAHVVLELALGAIKLRGRYAHESPGSRSPRSAMYVRHHASSLLSLALLGHLVWVNDVVDTPTGRAASAVLFVFHGGAVAAFAHAWASDAIGMGKVIVPHLPFAAAFAVHALL